MPKTCVHFSKVCNLYEKKEIHELRSADLLPLLLPGQEGPGHEEAVQAAEVQTSQAGEARQQGQQGGLRQAGPRQGQALQGGAQPMAHLGGLEEGMNPN